MIVKGGVCQGLFMMKMFQLLLNHNEELLHVKLTLQWWVSKPFFCAHKAGRTS